MTTTDENGNYTGRQLFYHEVVQQISPYIMNMTDEQKTQIVKRAIFFKKGTPYYEDDRFNSLSVLALQHMHLSRADNDSILSVVFGMGWDKQELIIKSFRDTEYQFTPKDKEEISYSAPKDFSYEIQTPVLPVLRYRGNQTRAILPSWKLRTK